ncbi:zinc finger protein 584 isoform X4 [Homo sapiens]|uniref:zinc finger protein 584 isoform X4 n=1 Tax=Homo sapiens TaxID=9606 RepID=UPI000387AE1F|nr:zinc finger protein 584 isoform X4 [Homo sapiens]XP_054176154.1 zinc finger protein 584 isoform X4 [Homo sapiens]|eukprot:XP_005258687.1 zinc finger protein 584 isoform X3 [Homo sapiens]
MAGEAEAQLDPSLQGLVMFEDVTVYFSREEWGLLNVTQKGLYRDVMLENFALVSSLGLAPSRSPVFTQLEDDEQSWVPSWVDVTPVSRAEARRGFGLGPACSCLSGLRLLIALLCICAELSTVGDSVRVLKCAHILKQMVCVEWRMREPILSI